MHDDDAAPALMAQTRQLLGLAGILAATLTADLNAQVVSVALPDVSGGLGLSHDPGTWLQSLYITGESFGMALAPWWAVTLTLRRFALFVIALSCATTLLIPQTGNLTLLYGLRLVQGLSAGLTIPLLMTTALRVLDPPIRLYGLAAYALSATLFPYLGPALAALWVGTAGWQFVFYEAIPTCVVAAALVWYGMPQDPPQYGRIARFDWRGALLVVLGFGALTTMLQQGDRYDWFNSDTICVLGLVSLVAIPLLLVNEWFHELPLLRLQLLGRRNFAYGALALFTFVIISLSASQVPLEYLEQVQRYRPLQAYPLTIEIVLTQLLMLPALALLLDVKRVDPRVVSFVGLSLILAACLGSSLLTGAWDRDQFYLWQGLQAVGQPMVVMPLLMIATNSVVPQEGPFASALVNAPRAIAEATGVWLLALIARWRGAYQSNLLADEAGRRRFRLLQGPGVSPHYPPPLAAGGQPRAPDSLYAFAQSVMRQTTVLMLSDAYVILAGLVVVLMIVLLVLPLRTYPPRIVFAKK